MGNENRRKNNNFTMVRLIATLFVFAGHMGVLLGIQPPLLGGFPVHELGVGLLFLISGYLITVSWLSDPTPVHYGIRRFFRLWPPFAVMILLMTFATGPLLSGLGAEGYFQESYKSYLLNLRFFIVYSQPGVFSELPYPNVTNGSLWTMPVEAFLYLLTPFLLTVLRVKYRSRKSFCFTAALTAVCVGVDLYLRVFDPGARLIFYGTDWIAAYHLAVFYMIGILYTYQEMQNRLNLQVGCGAMCLLLISQSFGTGAQYVLLYLILPYAVFSFVFAPKPAFGRLERMPEISYGIYLYGFFFQQLTIAFGRQHGINLSYLQALILSLIPTVAAALLSCFLVERPAMRFGRWLIRKGSQKRFGN